MQDTMAPRDSIGQEIATLLCKGYFRVRSLQEARILAAFLASTCPNTSLVTVGIMELIVNAIEHGNLGISSEEKARLQQEDQWLSEIEKRLELPEYKNQYVEIEFIRLEDEIHIKVTDQGKGFNWEQKRDKDTEDPAALHGRGLLLAKKLSFKSLQYSKTGNEVIGVISLK